jgi:coenzyme F420-reducing hydrogenase beta subunit
VTPKTQKKKKKGEITENGTKKKWNFLTILFEEMEAGAQHAGLTRQKEEEEVFDRRKMRKEKKRKEKRKRKGPCEFLRRKRVTTTKREEFEFGNE